MFTVEFYSTNEGRSPVKDFMETLPSKLRSKTLRAIRFLREDGNQIKPPFSMPLGDGLFELRIKFSSDIVRVIYFYLEGKIIVLTNGFIKKQQKTPRNEIELALKRRKLFLERIYKNEKENKEKKV